MCGLIASIDYSTSKYFAIDGEAFFSMLLLNSLRGAHSTGAFAVRIDGRSEFIKVIGGPHNLEKWKDWDDFLSRIPTKYTALVGHGRFATRGGISVKNAHPFKRGDITLVHNGTISNFEELKKIYKEKSAFEVDSDLCANLFQTYEVKEAIEKIEGAFAFIYYDNRDRKIRVIRNYERLLYMFKRTDRLQYLFASDEAIFDWLKSKYKFMGKSEIVPSGTLFTLSIDKEDVKEEKVKLHSHMFTPYAGGDYDYNGDSIDWRNWKVKNNSTAHIIPETYHHKRDNNLLNKIVETAFNKKEEPLASNVTRYTYENIDLNVGTYVRWIPNDYNESVDKNTKKVRTFLIGTLENMSLPVEVTAVTEQNINELIADGLLLGRIKSLTVFPPDNEIHCRVFVEDVKTIHQSLFSGINEDKKKAAPQSNSSPVKVKLYDGAEIDYPLWSGMAHFGCATCKTPILDQQADFVLMIDSKLYCPDCTIHARYPRN